MIFVTVGTHEQPFERLVKYMDLWANNHKEKVVIQIGSSTYEPKKATWSKWYPYKMMMEKVKKARIVITHGGPSSFFMPLQVRKMPIVVPRKKEFDEHVNNHQLDFCKEIELRQKSIIVVENVQDLEEIINNYNEISNMVWNGLNSNNAYFCKEIDRIVYELVGE